MRSGGRSDRAFLRVKSMHVALCTIYVSCPPLGVALKALCLKSSHQDFLTGVPSSLRTLGQSSDISHLSTHSFVQNFSSGPSSQFATTSAISIFGVMYGWISFLCIVLCSYA